MKEGNTTKEPDVDSLPENPAPVIAVHDVALVEFQMIVVELPWLMKVGFAVIVTVGCCCCC